MHSRRADVVFVAVGRPHLVGPEMIKPGAVVIDIGINQVTTADGGTRVVGDVDYERLRDVAGWITPVPGGVGPVTVAMLMRNTVRAAEAQLQHRRGPEKAALDTVRLNGLALSMRIGLHPHERDEPQPVLVNVELDSERRPIDGNPVPVVCYDKLAREIRTLAGSKHFSLVEDLADGIADLALADPRVRRAKVRVEKLRAVEGASAAGVEIERGYGGWSTREAHHPHDRQVNSTNVQPEVVRRTASR